MVSTVDTAPHIVDPKNPGAVDEIIHLGDHWEEQGLRANKSEILELNKEVNRLFQRAYSYLRAAKIFLDEVESYYYDSGALDFAALNKLALDVIHDIFTGRPVLHRKPKDRHLFATAITPDGAINYIETIVGNLQKRYIIKGDDGTGKSTLIQRIADAALMHGYDIEAYHCALEPDKLDHVVIPALSVAVVTEVEPHYYEPKKNDQVINTMSYLRVNLNDDFAGERRTAREMYRQSFNHAVQFLARAKHAHDEMERFYVPNMKFNEINARRQEILERILKLAEDRGSKKDLKEV
ncbi:hypothetical protein [Calderihabitans maritimus]|uniref:ATPase n=1 Tax=Calderihabitans maritimus TaxID=1246530 RepID=A0A1Z5HRM8_9FIRM|nr:hypothetical protein [Calderihabitans maritimus]GAW91975.1 hypothetical protein Desku_0518 [Calderihabitans maritimus]